MFLQTADVLVFEECVGKTEAESLALVGAVFEAHPDFLPAGAQSADSFINNLKVEKVSVRNQNAEDYYLVGLRTNYEETHVVGILGDGMVFYPYDWCTAGTS